MSADVRSDVIKAATLYVLLWLPALALASFLSLMGYIGAGFGLRISALALLAAIPVTLIGFWSFRVSAISSLMLFVCDLLTSAWPRVAIIRHFQSKTSLVLFAFMLLTLLLWGASPFASLTDFLSQIRDDCQS